MLYYYINDIKETTANRVYTIYIQYIYRRQYFRYKIILETILHNRCCSFGLQRTADNLVIYRARRTFAH